MRQIKTWQICLVSQQQTCFSFCSSSFLLRLSGHSCRFGGARLNRAKTWRLVNKQRRAGRRLAANCLHWGAVMASLKACKVSGPEGRNRGRYRKSPGAPRRIQTPNTSTHTRTNEKKCITHTPGDKGSVYHQHTHTHTLTWAAPLLMTPVNTLGVQ